MTDKLRKTKKPMKALVVVDLKWVQEYGMGLFLDQNPNPNRSPDVKSLPLSVTEFNMGGDGWFMEIQYPVEVDNVEQTVRISISKQHIVAVVEGNWAGNMMGFRP